MDRLRLHVALAVIVLLSGWTGTALAQREASPTPKYDMATETKLKGTVEEIREIATAKGNPAMHLMVKTGEQVLEVYLCPNAFLREMEMGFAKGDQIEVTGSKVKVNDIEVLLAREITKGTDTLVLRDKKGTPVWSPVRGG